MSRVLRFLFSTPRSPRTHKRELRTRLDLSTVLFEYLEIFHNRQHRHSVLGILSTVKYELRTPPVA